MTMQYTFKLSNTSKLPCASFSLPARACKTGAKLAKVKGSVCSGCYALKGFYNMPNTKNLREHNLATLPCDNDASAWLSWADAMIETIRKQDTSGYWRWHDSGDIQSLRHLETLAYIAYRMPEIQFWLPTKEKGLLSKYKADYHLPSNLVVRLSAAMIDGDAPLAHEHTSTVHKDKQPTGHQCPASSQGGACMRCRACWDSTVANVSYPKH